MFTFKRVVLTVAAAGLLSLPSLLSAAANPNAREGKWETTTNIEMPGMPMKMPPITATTCVTKEDLADPDKSLPKASKDDSCKVSDYKIEGTKVTWSVKCGGQRPVSGTGEMTYKGDSYEGTLKLNLEAKDTPVHEMIMHIKGHRIGDCTK